jgi:hypothetical protein
MHRGDAYMGFSQTDKIDYAVGGAPFDAEVLPRITRVEPDAGSLAGGADLTIYGTGFGVSTTSLTVTVGDGTAACDVTSISEAALHCRVQSLTPSALPAAPPTDAAAQARVGQELTSFPSQRGARFQWLDDGTGGLTGHYHGGAGYTVLDAFDAPLDYEAGQPGTRR